MPRVILTPNESIKQEQKKLFLSPEKSKVLQIFLLYNNYHFGLVFFTL